MREGRRLRARVRQSWPPDTAVVADLVQSAKTALAGVLAWVLASAALGLQQPFLAPWSAVLVVHATIYRSVSRGAQQVAATFGGVVLAWSAGQLFGLGSLGMGTMLLLAFGLGRLRWWRDEATTMATTGIVVLATNAIAATNVLAGRLLDTAIGVVVGLVVNLAVWPPLRDRAAWSRIDQLPQELADVLAELASGLRDDLPREETDVWVDRLREVDTRIDEAWGLLRQARESSRFNPRRSRPAGLEDLVDAIHLLELVVADLLSMVRTIATSAEHGTRWSEEFRTTWVRLVTATADAVHEHDEEALASVPPELDHLVSRLSDDSLARSAWHEYGGLLVNLRDVVAALTRVTVWGNRSDPSTRRTPRYDVPVRVPTIRRPSPRRRLSPEDEGYAHADDD